jgi:hypothetical protein
MTGFQTEQEIKNARHAIVNMTRPVGFVEVDETSMEELLQSSIEELSNEYIIDLEKTISDENGQSSEVEPNNKEAS